MNHPYEPYKTSSNTIVIINKIYYRFTGYEPKAGIPVWKRIESTSWGLIEV